MSSPFLQAGFWPFAATAIALVALFTISLMRAGRAAPAGPEPHSAPRGQALALAAGLPLLALALYAALGQPRALDPAERETGSVAQVESMVERLAARLKQEPGDVNGWLMLAHSYKVMGRAAESAGAFEQADRAAPDTAGPAPAGGAASWAGPAGLVAESVWQRDPNRLVDWIEVRMLAADDHFDARSLALLQRAVALAPEHPGVLMLSGLAALDQADFATARRAFTALRDQSEPGSEDRSALDQALVKLAHGVDPRRAAMPSSPASSR
jgi:cytochrome c-type biogenesis protein CcmH